MSYFAQSSTHLRINQDRKANGLPTLADTEILRLSRVLRNQESRLTDAEIQAMLITDGAVVPNADAEPKAPPIPVKAEIDSFAENEEASRRVFRVDVENLSPEKAIEAITNATKKGGKPGKKGSK